jgi:C-terminal processing protease CtpA/Prc
MLEMNNKRPACYLLLLPVLFFLGSCTAKEIPDPEPEDTVNTWIEETMRRHYLWEDEIPEKKHLDLSQEAEPFFFSLLTKKDGKTRSNESHYYYSSINKKSQSSKSYQGEGYSFGFEFQYYIITSLNKYALLTLYVLPGSPAERAGLKRGDWIMEINAGPVPGDGTSLMELLDTTSPVTVSFGVTTELKQGAELSVKTLTAEPVTDNPVFLHKIIPYKNRRIAYLVYNHFTSGPTEDYSDEQFNNSLREAFKWFKNEAPDAFILDLRYNGGGLVSSAQLLATMLAPESALNDVFCNLTYNGQRGSHADNSLKLNPTYMQQGPGGANLDLRTLYVITSSWTASASEAVINGLRPYMDVILIGEQTEGKNVGSLTFDDDRYEWELHPIVSRLSNKDGFSDYETGFPPQVPCNESAAKVYYDLGDEREYMLQEVLAYITGTRSSNAALRTAAEQPAGRILLGSSLERKKTPALVLDRLIK